jgi:hypothetical protein
MLNLAITAKAASGVQALSGKVSRISMCPEDPQVVNFTTAFLILWHKEADYLSRQPRTDYHANALVA